MAQNHLHIQVWNAILTSEIQTEAIYICLIVYVLNCLLHNWSLNSQLLLCTWNKFQTNIKMPYNISRMPQPNSNKFEVKLKK